MERDIAYMRATIARGLISKQENDELNLW